MKILLTGGKGFVGNFLLQNLSEKYEILAPTRQELNLLDLDSVNAWFNSNKVDAVIHCALTGREVLFSTDPVYLSDGLLMFRNLWLQKNNFKMFINMGTIYEMSLEKDNSFITEDEFLKHLPKTSYGYAKNLIARTIRETPDFYNLRLFGVFHETESEKRFFKKVQHLDKIIIDNDLYLDYIYLPDILPMISCILDGNAQDRDINMVYPNKYRLSELAYYLCDQLNLDKNKIIIKGHNGLNLTGNSEKLSKYNFSLIGIQKGLRNYQ